MRFRIYPREREKNVAVCDGCRRANQVRDQLDNGHSGSVVDFPLLAEHGP
jgi:hypothetical protein